MAREPFRVELQDNSKGVVKSMEGNVAAALAAMGIKAVGCIVRQMQTGYPRRIWRTGDLQRDVRSEVDENAEVVHVGNTLEYGVYVHEGTSKMAGRAYIKDALMDSANQAALKQVAEQELKKGF